MISYELQGGVASGFSRETSKVGRVLVVPDQERHSRTGLARVGVAGCRTSWASLARSGGSGPAGHCAEWRSLESLVSSELLCL